MNITLLKGKIHRATVTGADLDYEGSIAIDTKLLEAAGFREFERVDIYNCNNGERFSTYIILGEPGQVALNGAAARKVLPGDEVIIAAYAQMSEVEAETFQPQVVMVDKANRIKSVKGSRLEALSGIEL
ncbi:MAG: aspartate 1-decarboxylase [Verrucomicrobiae bacterium]|nr:aspartate 1-decarboxylase [Verrucomicrobiae bacterium]